MLTVTAALIFSRICTRSVATKSSVLRFQCSLLLFHPLCLLRAVSVSTVISAVLPGQTSGNFSSRKTRTMYRCLTRYPTFRQLRQPLHVFQSCRKKQGTVSLIRCFRSVTDFHRSNHHEATNRISMLSVYNPRVLQCTATRGDGIRRFVFRRVYPFNEIHSRSTRFVERVAEKFVASTRVSTRR